MRRSIALVASALCASTWAAAAYVNFESAHVHPIDLTPSGGRLLAVNTPDALLEVFTVEADGRLSPERTIRVGLEPVTVVARTDGEAWVVNNLSDSISIVDLSLGLTVETLDVGDEPTDVAFAAGRAFVSVSQEDEVEVYDLATLAFVAPVPLFSRDVRALALSNDGSKVYAVALRSGNQTTVVNANIIFDGNSVNMSAQRLAALGLRDMNCTPTPPPPYPPLPPGISRNPALDDPPASSNPANFPPVALIVGWDDGLARWTDEAGQNWNDCLPYRLPDKDLFVIDAATLGVTPVAHVGTSLFDVAVHPPSGKIYVPNTDARNLVRFEHPLGVQGHMVDNRLSVVDPSSGYSVTAIDLNTHVNRASDPGTNLAERQASISQPGMLVWNAAGSQGYMTAIGSRKLFRVDGACAAGGCIFGPNRAAPAAVEVGEGPTGVALAEAQDRAYVLNRISHSIAVVQASSLTLLDEIPLHDPSSTATREGRRFLYDAVDGSGHGDAACSSCHLFGDLDGLAWDLGNPEGDKVLYSALLDNVRFVLPLGTPPNDAPVECNPQFCASHTGFDPQKGPMTTQTLRGMLEPLHWRGDRPTMNAFNGAFVALMGTANVGTPSQPAGLSATDMEKFRQFALEMAFPPNPFRRVDDTTPCGPRATDPLCEVQPHGALDLGNPTEGALLFDNHLSDAGKTCKGCHAHPFGAAGGQLGGVTPQQPTSAAAAALFNGDADASPHNDVKIPHLRNMYDKFGAVWAAPAGAPPDTKTSFGYGHDGSIPDLLRFFSIDVFTLGEANRARIARDIATFMFYFPTGTKPAVGAQITVPQGAPPTGTAAEEPLLATLITLGDLSDPNRHCELTATSRLGGVERHWRLQGGVWLSDAEADPPLSTASLRAGAEGPLTFTCATLGSGLRLGGDRDGDAVLDADDCAPGDAGSVAPAETVTGLALGAGSQLTWDDQSGVAGGSLRYDVLGGGLLALHGVGIDAATACVAADLAAAGHVDGRPAPAAGDGYYYLIRARNGCGVASLGPGREALASLVCP